MSLVPYYHGDQIDFEGDILGRSPPLSPIQPDLGPVEDSPIPLVPYNPTPESSEVEEEDTDTPRTLKRRRSARTRPSKIDRVLTCHLENNRPEGSNYAGSEEYDDPPNLGPSPTRRQERMTRNVLHGMSIQATVGTYCAPIITGIGDFPVISPPERGPKEYDVKPRPLSLGSRRRPGKLGRGNQDSIVTTPALERFAIKPHNAAPDAITLPALERSPLHSSLAGSPDNRQNLPSIRNLSIPQFNDPAPTYLAGLSPKRSPPMTRTPGSHRQYSYQGPGISLLEHPSIYNSNSGRSSTRDASDSVCSEFATPPSVTTFTPTPGFTQSTAASDPASLSTLPEQEVMKLMSQEMTSLPPDSDTDTMGSPETSRIPGGFRCHYPGCSTISFKTRFLLESHMIVHSDQRSYFCLIEGCPRGIGGQGFKRKNEMIRCVSPPISILIVLLNTVLRRHGLVHTSHGYICPFCTDQQHGYPRPDNLRRHVRIQHEDVDRDDPLLLDVLQKARSVTNQVT